MYFDLEAFLVDVPILMMTFGEAFSCDFFLMEIGGHLWFDMVVPFGFIVYYLVIVWNSKKIIIMESKFEKLNLFKYKSC